MSRTLRCVAVPPAGVLHRHRVGPWAVGAGLLAGTWAVVRVSGDDVPAWEARLTNAVNGLPDRLLPAVWPVMQAGNFWVWAFAAPTAALATRRTGPAVAVTGATVTAWAAAKGVKRLAGRGRPADHLPEVTIRERGITGLGYVSGHAAIATALATVTAPWLPPWSRALPFAVAGAVGWARIYVGAHLPLDVAGGAGLGILCGLGASVAADNRATDPQG